MQILVLGKSYSTIKIADYLAENKNNIVFTTADCKMANNVFLNLNNTEEIKEFILANEVTFCIVADKALFKNSYSYISNETECIMLSLDTEAHRISNSIASGKKFAYKNKIQTAKFAVFEKAAVAIEYLKTTELPVIITPDTYIETEHPYIAETKDKAKKQIELLFQTGNKKIVTESYIQGIEYTKYLVSDGFVISDLIETVSYFDEISTNNTSYIQKNAKDKIENEIIPLFLDSFMEDGVEYQGILGFNFIIDRYNNVYFSKFKPFLDDIDTDIAILTVENLEEILYGAATGDLKDKEINVNQKYALSIETNGEIISVGANTMSRTFELLDFEGADKKLIKEAVNLWTR